MIPTRLSRLLQIELPVLAAGMGGIATPAFVAAVSNGGGAGTLGLFRTPPEIASTWVRETAGLTPRSFGIGVIPEIQPAAKGLSQLRAVLEVAPERCFLQFYGLPDASQLQCARSRGLPFLIQVGSAGDAQAAVDNGCSGLILQGIEAGGHLLGEASLFSLAEAVKQLFGRIPIVAAGGISCGADLYRALAFGFDGVLCGTLFVCAQEANAHPRYQQRILQAGRADTRRSRAFEFGWPGREHRVLDSEVARSAFGELPRATIGTTMVAGRKLPVWRYSAAVPTRDTSGDIDNMALYCGESCERIAAVKPAAQILAELESGYRQCTAGLHR